MEELTCVDVLLSCQYLVALDEITSLPPHLQMLLTRLKYM